MKYQVLFSMKNSEKMFNTVVCWNRDWDLKVNKHMEYLESLFELTRL